MKAIVIKLNDKVIAVHSLSDVSTKQFLDLEKEAKKTLKEYQSLFEHQIDRIKQLEEHNEKLELKCEKLEETCKDLYHQIAVDRGEEDEEEKEVNEDDSKADFEEFKKEVRNELLTNKKFEEFVISLFSKINNKKIKDTILDYENNSVEQLTTNNENNAQNG